MMRLIVPFLITIVAVGLFFKFTDPMFADIDTLRARQATLNNGLDNAKKLREVEQGLLDQYNAMAPADLESLNKLLPDDDDNVRLIIDINNIAKPYGMKLKNPQIKTTEDKASDAVARDRNHAQQASVALSFSVNGDYLSFQSFLNDLAHSLRLVDVSAVNFTAGDTGTNDYNVEVQTYWLK